ncbi:hypothetical protein PIB30_066146 [Stylosanthes scabra]|uniref:PGG domain-containing protein n=1 Tax=Stylosanthes scabra TaxID=79078 RepID=A0ABU6SN39_9FABA|nr:hypothetical protein [Stylosanthes scabra]
MSEATANVNIVEEAEEKKKWCSKIFEWLFTYDKEKWLEEMRGNLGLIASIIATITFQSALNPPGGVLQAGVSDKANLLNCSVPNSTKTLCAGQALLSLQKSDYYTAFLVYNTLCFIASLSVCLLLVSGLPLKDRFTVWLLLIAMCITVITLMAAYLMGVVLSKHYAFLFGVASKSRNASLRYVNNRS